MGAAGNEMKGRELAVAIPLTMSRSGSVSSRTMDPVRSSTERTAATVSSCESSWMEIGRRLGGTRQAAE